MKNLIKYRVSVADSMVLIGIGLAASYWVLESILNLFTSRNVNFFNQLLGPDINEIWPRIIVFCLFIFFGSHVQFTINNRKKAEEALKESEEKYRTILESMEEGYYEVQVKLMGIPGDDLFWDGPTDDIHAIEEVEAPIFDNLEVAYTKA